jgi:hypothetical protein
MTTSQVILVHPNPGPYGHTESDVRWTLLVEPFAVCATKGAGLTVRAGTVYPGSSFGLFLRLRNTRHW